ncbi:FHA domain-containing protein [Sporomusa aerivorans]|uniref:FHA domain-containing protein n=1 Tax=Sporomusa aerivorans TaxID=204936 RepID=UPI003529E2D2
MPGKMQVLNIVVVALQYSLVLLLYYFLYRVVKLATRDLAVLATNRPPQRCVSENPAALKPARLVVIDDKQALLSQTVFAIVDSLIIGRSEHNDITINDSFISHEHACISRSRHNYLLADLNSTNGTLLNGRRIEEETALVNEDTIQIGAVTFKFER